jgi:DNA-binding transcriptional LysR family regulator
MFIRDTEIFRTVMATGNASKAAQMLQISQPAVSQAIQRLEKRAGIALFERLRGRLQARPEAHSFLQEVDTCLNSIDQLEQKLASLRQFSVNQLRIASYPALGLAYLPKVIAQLRQDLPDLYISLEIASSNQVRQRVLSRQCDIGLMADEVATVGLQHALLHKAFGVVAVPKKHPLAHRKLITAKEFISYPHIGLNADDASTKRLMIALGPLSHLFRPVVQTPYGVSICELALNGVGIGLVNPLIATAYQERGLRLIAFELNIEFRCLVGTQPATPLSNTAQNFLKALRTLIRETDYAMRIRGPESTTT